VDQTAMVQAIKQEETTLTLGVDPDATNSDLQTTHMGLETRTHQEVSVEVPVVAMMMIQPTNLAQVVTTPQAWAKETILMALAAVLEVVEAYLQQMMI